VETQGPSWPVLDLHERRVLGVLVEKAKTTPDTYPMSINALVTGCNQKSNRDPVLQLSDVDVEETLLRLQKKGLVIKLTGGRVERWRHQLYEAWHVDKADLAVLAELLLRGPQTEAELRSRASRMEPIDDAEALRAILKPLTERGLVVYLGMPGRRGTMVTHGFHAPQELEHLRRHGEEAAGPAPQPVPAVSPEWELSLRQARDEIARLNQEVQELRTTVAELRQAVVTLTAQLRDVRQGLGLPG
jgi:hypothetical protein